MSTPGHQWSAAEAQERARLTLPVVACVLLSVVAMYLPLPKRFVAAVPLLLAVVLSVRLLRFLRHRRGRDKIWPAVTLVMVGALLASLVVQGLFYRTVAPYEQCLAGALTAQAKADCESLPGARLLGVAPTIGQRVGQAHGRSAPGAATTTTSARS